MADHPDPMVAKGRERVRRRKRRRSPLRWEETSLDLDVALNRDRRDDGIPGCRRCGGRVFCICPNGPVF